jgi:hypothetical protein
VPPLRLGQIEHPSLTRPEHRRSFDDTARFLVGHIFSARNVCRDMRQFFDLSRVRSNMRSRYEMTTDHARAQCSVRSICELMGKQHSAADRIELSSDTQSEEFGFLRLARKFRKSPRTAPKRLVRGSQSHRRTWDNAPVHSGNQREPERLVPRMKAVTRTNRK